jgi:hypothetical protein
MLISIIVIFLYKKITIINLILTRLKITIIKIKKITIIKILTALILTRLPNQC